MGIEVVGFGTFCKMILAFIYIYIHVCAFAFYLLVISLVCDITSYVMNVHLELLLYSFSVVCRGHFMKYIDHYILAQGGIHNITAFAVAFNIFFPLPPHLFWDVTLSDAHLYEISVSSSDDVRCSVQHFLL